MGSSSGLREVADAVHPGEIDVLRPQRRDDRAALRAVLDAAVARLVARAAAERWPIRADHCFLRIAYDHAVGAKWDTMHARPAWRSLPLERLRAAAAVATRIEREGLPTLCVLNAISLGYRRR